MAKKCKFTCTCTTVSNASAAFSFFAIQSLTAIFLYSPEFCILCTKKVYWQRNNWLRRLASKGTSKSDGQSKEEEQKRRKILLDEVKGRDGWMNSIHDSSLSWQFSKSEKEESVPELIQWWSSFLVNGQIESNFCLCLRRKPAKPNERERKVAFEANEANTHFIRRLSVSESRWGNSKKRSKEQMFCNCPCEQVCVCVNVCPTWQCDASSPLTSTFFHSLLY